MLALKSIRRAKGQAKTCCICWLEIQDTANFVPNLRADNYSLRREPL